MAFIVLNVFNDVETDIINTEEVEIEETDELSENEPVEVEADTEVSELGCEGIINAFKGQITSNIHEVSPSLTKNYNNCIEYGTPNPPEEKNVEKKIKKDKK